MNGKWTKPAIAMVIGCTLVSCGKKKDDSTLRDAPSTSQVGLLMLNALSSAGTVGGAGMAADKAGKKSGATSLALMSSAVCHNETPINPDDAVFASTNSSNLGEVNERAPYFAAAACYCTMTQEGGRALKSALLMPAALSCSLGDVKFDGSEVDVPITIPVDTKCFTEQMVEDLHSFGMNEISTTYTAGPVTGDNATKYDRQVTVPVQMGESVQTLTMLFGLTSDHVNIAYKFTDASGVGESAAASLDFASNTMKFERVEVAGWTASGMSGDSPRVHHSRIYVKGKFDEKGNFTEVTSMEGAASGIWGHAANGSSPATASGNLITMKGNPKDGIRTHDYNLSVQTFGTVPSHTAKENMDECEWPGGVNGSCSAVPERNACFGDDAATCAGNDGLKFTSDADIAFFHFPTFAFAASPGYASPDDFFTGGGARLEFDSVSLTK